MHTTIQSIHSYWAYLALLLLVVAVINAFLKLSQKKSFEPIDRKISLFAMIATHIQLILGLILLFTSAYWQTAMDCGMGEVMKDSVLRLYIVEHPFTNILAIVLITIGWSKHKKKEADNGKFKTIGIFYVLGLVLLLSRIPWEAWMS